MRNLNRRLIYILYIIPVTIGSLFSQTYKIVDTGQLKCYGDVNEISFPTAGLPFFGQDAQINGYQPSYTNNNDGTVTDNVTGLMWQKSADMNDDGIINVDDKLSYDDALSFAESFSLAGYNDWRLPNIKEIYSLIMFYGLDPSGYDGTDTEQLVPFIDTGYFEFGYGDTDSGERIIDAQFASSTLYFGTTMNGAETMFGVNFADGRIKGYPTGPMPGQSEGKGFYLLYVRGNSDYGLNDFVDNDDETITDRATGLMWSKNDSGDMNWSEALAFVQEKNSENYLGHNDWRLPNVKELQSIVDYTRSPQTTNSPSINPLFNCSTISDEGDGINYPFYWSSTTHANMMNGSNAAYVTFGEALGWMQDFMRNYQLMDVHGAGAQRSDPKTGDPGDYPYGHGPQGDVIRIYNFVRLVRDTEIETGLGEVEPSLPNSYVLEQNYPNPFNPETNITFNLTKESHVSLKVFNSLGREVATLINENKNAGLHKINFYANELSSDIYYYQILTGDFLSVKKMVLLK